MIAAARFMRSSSDTPDAPFSLSSKAFFSASIVACLRMYSEAFAASASAILLLQSTADGKSSSSFTFMARPPGEFRVFLENRGLAGFDLSQGVSRDDQSE